MGDSDGRHALQGDVEAQRVVIVGAGEQAELAYEYLTRDSPHEVAGFSVEAAYVQGERYLGLPLVALEDLPRAFPPDRHRALIAVSSTQLNRVRARLLAQVRSLGYRCISYVSSRAFVWPSVRIGENVFVFEHNVLQHGVSVADNVILWSGNHVGHRSTIGADCFVSSHVVISGFCTIGSGSYLGVNCAIANDLTVGRDCVIGAGAVVIADADPRSVYVGNPARATGRDSFDTFGVYA